MRALLPIAVGPYRRRILTVLVVPVATLGAVVGIAVSSLGGLSLWRVALTALAMAVFAASMTMAVSAEIWMRRDRRRAPSVRETDDALVERLIEEGDLAAVDAARRETARAVIDRRRLALPLQIAGHGALGIACVGGILAVLAFGAPPWTTAAFGGALVSVASVTGALQVLGRTELVADAFALPAPHPAGADDLIDLPRLYLPVLVLVCVSGAVFVLDFVLAWGIPWMGTAAPLLVLAAAAYMARFSWKQTDPVLIRKRAAARARNGDPPS